jgi:hypothetical protein
MFWNNSGFSKVSTEVSNLSAAKFFEQLELLPIKIILFVGFPQPGQSLVNNERQLNQVVGFINRKFILMRLQ